MIIPYLIAQILNQTTAGNRVYPLMIPQEGTFPAIRLSHTSLTGDNSKSPMSCLDTSAVQISVFASSYREGREIAEKIRELIDRTAHQVITSTGIITDTQVESIRDGAYEPEKRLYHFILDVSATSQIIP